MIIAAADVFADYMMMVWFRRRYTGMLRQMLDYFSPLFTRRFFADTPRCHDALRARCFRDTIRHACC